MTIRTTALLLFFLLATIAGASQTKTSISGTVRDINQETLAGAEVSLLNGPDSAVVQTRITKDNGKFTLSDFPFGKYILAIKSIGQKKYFSNIITITEQQNAIELPVIILIPEKQKALKEVVVNAKKPLLEQEIDRTIVNVEAMITAATSNVLELLEKTPGVAVTADGEISLNSKSGVLVLIEGRQTYMSTADLAAYLRSIPGGTIDKIELITNPPARYDAAGGAVINIRFKKNKMAGFTGNLSSSFSQGISNRWYNSLNLNYNTKKLSLFGNFSYNDDKGFLDERNYRTYFDSLHNITSKGTFLNYRTEWGGDGNARLGFDYSLTPKTAVGMQFLSYFRSRKEEMIYNNYFDESGLNPEADAYGTMNGNYSWAQVNVNANALHKFNNNGHEISAEANYIRYNNNAEQVLNNYLNAFTSNGDSNYLFRYDMPSRLDIYVLKADYSYPMKNRFSFSAGYKSSWVKNDNTSDFYDIKNGGSIYDPSRSNHFVYRENINALYVNGKKDWKRWSTQIGLRMENSNTEGHLIGNAAVPDSKVSRNYTGLFPSMYVSYLLDSATKQKITINVARRISRPYYQQLNPFLIFIDRYNYRTGNPYLAPAYNFQAELNYNYKQWFMFSMGYERYDDAIFSATRVVDSIFLTRTENAAMRRMLVTNFNFQIPVAKWWRMNLMLAVANFKTSGEIYGEDLSQNINAFRIQSFNMFTISKTWSAELVGRYTHRVVNLQRIMEPRWYMNFALQKKILKGKGNLKLTVDDIFWSQKYKDITLASGAESARYEIRDSRRVGLAFNFNFGKDTFNRKRRNVEGGDDIKGRTE